MVWLNLNQQSLWLLSSYKSILRMLNSVNKSYLILSTYFFTVSNINHSLFAQGILFHTDISSSVEFFSNWKQLAFCQCSQCLFNQSCNLRFPCGDLLPTTCIESGAYFITDGNSPSKEEHFICKDLKGKF